MLSTGHVQLVTARGPTCSIVASEFANAPIERAAASAVARLPQMIYTYHRPVGQTQHISHLRIALQRVACFRNTQGLQSRVQRRAPEVQPTHLAARRLRGVGCKAAADADRGSEPPATQYTLTSEPGASVADSSSQFLSSAAPKQPQRAQQPDALAAARQQWQDSASAGPVSTASQSRQQQAPARSSAYDQTPTSQQQVAQQAVQRSAAASLQNARPALIGGGLFLGGTLLIAIIRLISKNMSSEYKQRRSVLKNQTVVETLKKYLPDNRMALDKEWVKRCCRCMPGVVRTIRRSTGFSPEEIFRKYMWFLLRERVFDQSAVDDMVLLKGSLGLTDTQVAEALKERAQRVYERYGNVMLDVKGMTKAGIDRKATCRQLFSKILYLAENDQLIDQEGPAASAADIPGVFGATEDDASKLRIISLNEVDFDVLEAQFLPDPGSQPPPIV